ncbi:MAG: polymer-forming cytoskeletal protein [Candidatus Omnitrophota bacterium]|nr:MAG: polymer-forming cytoskeletal protein [Candidatus Omnitrophota bacterium]
MVRRREEERDEEKRILDVNAAMQGSLVFSDPVNLRINGKFEGTLITKGNLIIGESASVDAEIVGEHIAIAGKVEGKIKATKTISLTPTADVLADVETPKISIEEGGVFNGRCKMPQGKMTLGELSDYLSIEEVKIMEWVSSGRIPVEKSGDDLLFDRKEVEAWIGQNV